MRRAALLLLGWTALVGFFGGQFVLDDPDHREPRFVRRWTGAPLTRGRRIAALFELLSAAADMLERERIEYWIEAGTLMGAHRNGALIPWDKDLDIGMMDAGVARLQSATRAELALPDWVKLEVAGSTEHPDDSNPMHINTICARFIDTRSGLYIDIWRWFPYSLRQHQGRLQPAKVAEWLQTQRGSAAAAAVAAGCSGPDRPCTEELTRGCVGPPTA